MNAGRFCDAFTEQWKRDVEDAGDILLCDYKHDKIWTEYMLGRNDSFLGRLAQTLSFSMAREWYTLDAVYYNPQPNLFPAGGMYPARLDVLIEHENGSKVEEEMWKLLLWRSPLKVLIFYDYREDRKERDPKKKTWLDEKLQTLCEMGQEVHDRWPEASDTEYLFLVGNRADADSAPSWRRWIVKPGDFGRPQLSVEMNPRISFRLG